ncbi:hypothetical protein MHTCC0001_36990 [Flavobacteriaceae bacterium MHTCC 0001]
MWVPGVGADVGACVVNTGVGDDVGASVSAESLMLYIKYLSIFLQ